MYYECVFALGLFNPSNTPGISWSGPCVQEGQCCTSSLVSASITQSCGDGCCLEESGRSALVHFSLVLSCLPVLPHRPQSLFLLGHSSRPPQYSVA